MTEFPKNIKFKYSWRKYQQRVLDELKDHLSDRHLHIIAPPGSGKTVLGLEVAIQLNKPTLILAPTLAIRNQWIHRFCELFLQTQSVPDWISRDIRNPNFLTVVTYQGLHIACHNLKSKIDESETEIKKADKNTNPNLDKIIRGLKSQNIQTVIVDEAHHLKNEWWQTLTKVKDRLDPVIVGLTATPPYDVTATEWKRYITMNGPVDTEITAPELVKEGDLCPHQDYIHFTFPTENENEKIIQFRQRIEELFHEIKMDETIANAIKCHPVWLSPTEQLEWIYTHLSSYSACLIFLHAMGVEIPEIHLEIIGDKKFVVPKLNYEWMEILLDFYLFQEKEYFKPYQAHQQSLENKLKRAGAIEKKQINFLHNKRVTGFLTSSISKLNGIKEIVDFEYKQLGKDLRMVILADYIRKEFFVHSDENKSEINKIGILPIFEKLRRENSDRKKIGVLTGSIILIPKSAFVSLKAKANALGITEINSSAVPFDEEYIQIHRSEPIKNEVIHMITQIFEEGKIEVLIGTKSLLGEGWDAPSINSLILASFVGSFVLSNQMRGRAIRIHNGNSEKTGNIWHLVTLDPTSETGGDDLELLKRRFRSFVGVSFKEEEAGIENGIGRLNLPENIQKKEELLKKNSEMFLLAADRKSLKQRWNTALETGVTLVEEIKIPFQEEKEYQQLKAFYLNKTIANLLATLASGLAGFGSNSLELIYKIVRDTKSVQDLYFLLGFFGLIGVGIFGRLTYKTLRLYLKYRDISKDVHQIGEALLNALIKANVIRSNYSEFKVESTIDQNGAVFCHLEGGTTFEKSIFINALHEVIVPIDNPRYVILRKNRFMFYVKQKDYHSVPEVLGKNKNLAEYFKNQWERLVGNCDLVFTRTIDGRKLLLRARIKSLAVQFEDSVEHVNKWR